MSVNGGAVRQMGFALRSDKGLMWAMAAKLTGAWPKEIMDHSDEEIYLAAQLQHRLWKEQYEQ